jgi:outer membrane protein TolC
MLALATPSALYAQAAPGAAPAAPAPAAPAPTAPVQGAAPAAGASTFAPASAPAQTAAPAAPAAAQPATDPTRSADSLTIEGLNIQQGGLTVEDTVRRALAVSSSAGEKQAELDAANARITQTIVQFVPKLTLKASYMRLSPVESELGGALVGASAAGPLRVDGERVLDSAGNPIGAAAFNFPSVEDTFALTASLAIPLSDYLLRLSDASAGAEASREAAKLALAAAESKVRTDARVLYYNWLRAHAQVFLTNNAVERTKARLEDARAASSVGKLSNADLMRVEALVANAQLVQTQAEALRMLIGAQLGIIMRDTKGGIYTVGSTLPEVNAVPVPEAEGRKMIAEALQTRLELKAVDATIDALDHGETALRASSWPRLDAVGEITYSNPNQRYFPVEDKWNMSWAAGLVASWTVDAPFMGGAQGDELAANIAGLRATRGGVEAMVVNEVVTAQLDVVKARAALAAGETSVRAAEEAYRVATDLFRVGRGTTSDLIDAESDLLTAKAGIVNARTELAIAAARLEYAMGREASAFVASRGK